MSPLDYMHVRERLAELYRLVNRVDDARAIESELREILVVAEHDFPMKQRLERTR